MKHDPLEDQARTLQATGAYRILRRIAPLPLETQMLVIGKPVGVFGATLLSTHLRIATLPSETPTGMLFGLSLLCGIGFTISLFVANLAFSGSDLAVPAKMGIFAGSILSALLGWLWLRFSYQRVRE